MERKGALRCVSASRVGCTRRDDVGDRAGGLHEVDGRGEVDVGGLVAVAIVTAEGVDGAGHVAAAGGDATAVAVVAR